MSSPTKLFSAQAANGVSTNFRSFGKLITLLVAGTFGSGTVTVQASPDEGTTWVDTPVTATAAGIVNFIAGEGLVFRLSLTGATSPNLNAWVAYEA